MNLFKIFTTIAITFNNCNNENFHRLNFLSFFIAGLFQSIICSNLRTKTKLHFL